MSNCLIYHQAQLEQLHFVLLWINVLIYAMNVNSTTALTRELKPLEAPFLSTSDPGFLWLKYQILINFGDWLKTIKVRSGVYKKAKKQKMFI